MRGETKASPRPRNKVSLWRAAISRSLWGWMGTMYFFGIWQLLETLGLPLPEVPWGPGIVLSTIITAFMIPWWWVAEWARGTFQFPRWRRKR